MHIVWARYATGEESCDECLALEGIYEDFTDIPDDPHPNCDCWIDAADAESVEVLREETVRRRLPDEWERVDVIGKGITGTNAVTITLSYSETVTGTGMIGGQLAPGGRGVTGSFSYAESETRGISGADTTSHTFNYRDDVGGDVQYVYAVYEVWEVSTVRHILMGQSLHVEEHVVDVEKTLLTYEYVDANDAGGGGGFDEDDLPDGDEDFDDDLPDGDMDIGDDG